MGEASTFDNLRAEIELCREATGKEFLVVGVGGVESLAVFNAAVDVAGANAVMAIVVHSTFTSSALPHKILPLLSKASRHSYCAVDLSDTYNQFLNSRIDLLGVEVEKLHYTMEPRHKEEAIFSLRTQLLRSVASRHDAALLTPCCHTKRLEWLKSGYPNVPFGDWNPTHACSLQSIRIAMSERYPDCGIDYFKPGFDLRPDGGPYFDNTYSDTVNPLRANPSLGLGYFQKEIQIYDQDETPHNT